MFLIFIGIWSYRVLEERQGPPFEDVVILLLNLADFNERLGVYHSQISFNKVINCVKTLPCELI